MANRTNRLMHETSPYLLQHACNPVHWQPWGEAAFADARQSDVPVFLSIGYSTCHWCHVMERESFEDVRVAAFLNEHFVCIKVDREERPDIDHLYMQACTAMTGQGGWPLSCFVTPDKKPFFAGTYFPKDDRPGMRGFLSILEAIAGLWAGDRQRLLSASEDVFAHLMRTSESSVAAPVADMCAVAFEQLCSAFDATYGGFGSQPKFPSAHNLLFLLRYAMATGDGRAADMVRTSLAAMRRGGIWDHIGGGFCRYATDRIWLVPHFEKMMYDNAMLAIAFCEAGAAVDRSFFSTVRRIFAYAFADMADTDGGFFTARDADSEGEEGRFYVFTPQEIRKALGEDDGRRFSRLFDITAQGNFEGKSIPNLLRSDPTDEDMAFADACFPALLRYRSRRIPPLRDDKKLASVNGLMLAALATAGRIMDDAALVEAAVNTGRFILDTLFQGDRLHASLCRGRLRHPATSDDYAYVLWGLFSLYQATLQPEWLSRCLRLADFMLGLFWEGKGALYLAGQDVRDMPLRTRNIHDGALPSGNAVAAQQLLRLADVTRKNAYREAAMAVIDAVTAELHAYPAGCTGLLCADLYVRHGSVLAVVAQGAGLDDMLQALRGYNPFLTVAVCGDGCSDMDRLAPHTQGCKPLGGRATAYICTPKGCLAPLADPAQAARAAGLQC